MDLKVFFIVLVTSIAFTLSASAQITREVVERECLMVTFYPKGEVPKKPVPFRGALLDRPQFLIGFGIPREKTISESIKPYFEFYDSNAYIDTNVFYFMLTDKVQLSHFYEQHDLNMEKDSIYVSESYKDRDDFQDLVRDRLSSHYYYLKDSQRTVQFVVLRGTWVKYSVPKKPRIVFGLVKREYESDRYDIYLLKDIHEIYSIDRITDENLLIYPMSDYTVGFLRDGEVFEEPSLR